VFLAAKIYIYNYCSSDVYDEAKKLMDDLIRRFYVGWGFFEDELLSIAHTLKNLSSDVKLYDNTAQLSENILEMPVILVGNGPSLDTNWQIVKAMEKKAIIIGCSQSSLKTLYEYGIKPDYFVIMERLKCVKNWLDLVKDEDYKKSLKFISVNHIHPDVGGVFGEWGLAFKTFDAGARLGVLCTEGAEMHVLQHSSNAGVNTAIAVIGELGFKTCYLFGIDLGYKVKGNHHSSKSAYYGKDDEGNKIDLARHETGQMTCEGNFGGTVYTEIPMDTSRNSMEFSLGANKQLNCFNCSDGALINGAEPFLSKDLNITEDISNKSEVIEHIFETAFPNQSNFTYDELCEKFEMLTIEFDDIFGDLLATLDRPAESLMDVVDIFSRQHQILRHCGKPGVSLFRMMMSGSVNSVLTSSLYLMSVIATKANFDEIWVEVKAIQRESIENCRSKLKTHYKILDQIDRFET